MCCFHPKAQLMLLHQAQAVCSGMLKAVKHLGQFKILCFQNFCFKYFASLPTPVPISSERSSFSHQAGVSICRIQFNVKGFLKSDLNTGGYAGLFSKETHIQLCAKPVLVNCMFYQAIKICGPASESQRQHHYNIFFCMGLNQRVHTNSLNMRMCIRRVRMQLHLEKGCRIPT